MARTRTRPLPAGRMPVGLARGLALGLLALGLGLAALCAPAAAGVGLAVIALYNGVYTPLKKRTALALLAGGLAGAAPPVLGWAAAGAPHPALPPLAVAGVLYVWQVPHFWLLAWRHREDFAAAGFKAPGSFPYRNHLPLAVWLAAYCAALAFIPAFNLVDTAPAKWLCVGLAALLAAGARPILARSRLGLGLVNLSMLLFLCGLAADAYWLAP
jgi:protoheme IX farnesyltransferase